MPNRACESTSRSAYLATVNVSSAAVIGMFPYRIILAKVKCKPEDACFCKLRDIHYLREEERIWTTYSISQVHAICLESGN
jgi:hypothetical protein